MSLVEKRYAGGLLEVSKEKNTCKKTLEDLTFVVDTINQNSSLREFLLNPQFGNEEKKNMLKIMFEEMTCKELIVFLDILIDKNRIPHIEGILKEYRRSFFEEEKILDMKIVTATTLEDSEIKAIAGKYRDLYNMQDVVVTVEFDELLIGGLKIYIGDMIVNNSVRTRLEMLKQHILS